MKQHTSQFKEAIKDMGREIESIITYGETTLHEELYAVTPLFQSNLLKSAMKQLDIESSVDIPLETVLNYKLGILVNEEYEYLDYGNYVVYKSEKQEDTDTYKITCYDKMLYSMKMNEKLDITYPITIKNYLSAIANKIGLELKESTFYNQDLTIKNELYEGLEYTYRDILDEIAQATGSIICINNDDQIEVRYPNITGDTIDEEFLKDVNVKFGEKYGKINSIVLSRAGGSDNVYLRDEESVATDGLCEVKISDNQILNFNDRSDYLQGILNALDGFYYYINDFNSTGILYYDIYDVYNIQIGENTYQCVMLNDEINIKQGIEEIIHTDMPEQSETDYTKADKTDQKINETYIIVDKQNQTIESVVSNVTEQNNKISQITQTVDEINSKISDIADITTYGESDRAEVELLEINESEPIMIKVHPTSTNISYLYPRDNLYPSDIQYMPNRIVRFTRTYEEEGQTLTEDVDYELPDDLLRYSDTVYDEFYLDCDSQTCQVIKRCAYNADGTVRALGTEITTDYPYPTIILKEGNYTITLPGYNFGYIYARLMAKNIYTTQFYTKVETDSRINQKADEINLGVNQTLRNYSTTNQMNSAINLKANEITSSVSETYETKSNANTNYSRLTQTANEISTEVSKKVGNNEVISKINQSPESVSINANKINLNGKTINLTSDNIAIKSTNFNVDKNGNLTCNNAKMNNATMNNAKITNGAIKMESDSGTNSISLIDKNNKNNYLGISDLGVVIYGGSDNEISIQCDKYGTTSIDLAQGWNGYTGITPFEITTPKVTQTSLEKDKKNFKKFENAIEIIKDIDIYKYNLKSEDNETKKHIGFVIGDKFNYSEEVTSQNNDGVDLYSFVSLCCQAIKEQQKKIEELEQRLEEK